MNDDAMARENGTWRPGPDAEELMAEAIDEAVAVIVSMVEAEARKGIAPAPDLVAQLVIAIEDRTEDAERRIAGRERAEWNRAAIAGLRRRCERLEALHRMSPIRRNRRRGRERLLSGEERPAGTR